MAIIIKDEQIDISLLKDKRIAIIGYGSQGHAQAQNLRDAGLEVVIGLRYGGSSWQKAQEDKFVPLPIPEAVKYADYIQILLPDGVQPSVYEEFIKENLTENKILGFSHGFNIHFRQIIPPENVDVVMVAPKGPGTLVRTMYKENRGVPALVAIYQDYSKKARDYALCYAKGIGAGRVGIIETTFKEETETDLFGEQVVLCGGVTELIRAAFDTLVESGYQPEVAYFECLHELKLIVDLIHTQGITGMRNIISETALYGDLTRGKRVINNQVRKTMRNILKEIQSGNFAKEWILENKTNKPSFNLLKQIDEEHLIEKIGKELRSKIFQK